MLFNTLSFALFFSGVLLVYRLAPRNARNQILLGASLLFYFLWLPSYILLLLGDLLVNYALLRAMVRSRRPRAYLVASIGFTLGLLLGFKYASMAVLTAAPFLQSAFGLTPPIPEFFLPLGISFYSFQILALTIDTYRRDIEPIDSLQRYMLFISFFPQLVAGPILRGHEFLPQLQRGGELTSDRTRRGIWLIGIGLGKKVLLADFLLSGFADMVFDAHVVESAPFYWIGLYSFAFQIYFDFSGYTDMARGMALLMGFELPLNFKEPYLSRDPSEFWSRWHITLSRWLSDYLYIPLGGNRRGPGRTRRNLMITMLLGGLWHGASWNFVIWGGLHGLVLVAHRVIGRRNVGLDANFTWADVLRAVAFFHVVCLIWVFFRAETFDGAVRYIGILFAGSNPYGWPALQTSIVIACGALHVAERLGRLRATAIRTRLDALPGGTLIEGSIFGVLLGLIIMLSGSGKEFIYFQF